MPLAAGRLPMSALPTLRPWQAKEIIEHGYEAKRAIFASPRTGKTRVGCEGLRDLWTVGYERGVVVAPIAVCSLWADALVANGVPVLRGYELTVAAVAALLKTRPKGVLVLGQDTIGRRIRKRRPTETGLPPRLADCILAWGPQAYIRDESHRDKDPQSEMGKASRRIAKKARWARVLTGTPTPNHYGDLWGQVYALDPDGWGTWPQFRAKYLITDPVYPSIVRGHVNVGELQSRLLTCASFVRREDVFGPDSWQTVERRIPLPPTARVLYDRLAHEWILDAEKSGLDVRADHVLKRLVRLQQLCSGYLPDETGLLSTIHTAKIDAVISDLSEIVASGEKAVIFHRFRWEATAYAAALHEAFPKVLVRNINGTTPQHERAEIVATFERHPKSMIVVAQTRSAGLGISLAEATHALFVSQTFSFSDEEQARDRVYKPGAARCATYYRMADTVDEFIADVINTKADIHRAVTRADREVLAFGRIQRTRTKIA
jgi:hypothetical protein